MKESPLFSKLYDLTKWLLEHTAKFPRHERASLGRRIDDAVLALYRQLLLAAQSRAKRSAALESASEELECLKLFLRLARDLQILSLKQYEFASRQVVEVGRLLGGWKRKIGREAGDDSTEMV